MNENVNYQSIEEIDALYVDLFCGAGGTSTGVEKARIFGRKCAKVVACVNHDKNAIASHASNHPDAMHFTEDIRTLELSPLKTHLHKCRKEHPEAAVVLWASLECTDFSKAKGGQARNPDSRTLAEHLFRYIEAIEPDYIMIENVEEFMSWGEVDENGKPISMDKGKSYQRWVRNVKRYGYDFSHRILNAADFGAYTSRKRFFGIFAKKGLPIVFPSPTHAKKAENTLFGSRQKWKAVKDVLDFSDEGSQIDEPAQTITANRKWHYLMNPQFAPSSGCGIDNPCFTLIAKMDKKPPYLVVTETGDIAIEVYETDSPMVRKIKEFMAAHGIVDIKMRMLKIVELKRIMGFPEDYVLVGTQADQKKFIGNAVEVNMARVLCEALCKRLVELKRKVA